MKTKQMMITQNQIRISTTLPSNYITAGLVLSGGGAAKHYLHEIIKILNVF